MGRTSCCVPPAQSSRLCCCSAVQVRSQPNRKASWRICSRPIVRVHAEIPNDARTAAYLGTERDGAGVVIDDAGLVVTIGYLITEAMGAEVTAGSGRVSRASVVGFDIASGLGLLRAAEPFAVKPMPIGTAKGLAEGTPVVVAGARWTGGGAGRRRSVAPRLRRVLGIPSRGCHFHRAGTSGLEWCRFARARRQARRDRLAGGQRRQGKPARQYVRADRPPAAGHGRPAGARPAIGATASLARRQSAGVGRQARRRPRRVGRSERQSGCPARRSGHRDRRGAGPRPCGFLSHAVAASATPGLRSGSASFGKARSTRSRSRRSTGIAT